MERSLKPDQELHKLLLSLLQRDRGKWKDSWLHAANTPDLAGIYVSLSGYFSLIFTEDVHGDN